MRHGKIHVYDKKKGNSHFLSKDFNEVQELIDYIDKYYDDNGMEDVDVSVECEDLTEMDIYELNSVWISVIKD